jgi:hypothetical protein
MSSKDAVARTNGPDELLERNDLDSRPKDWPMLAGWICSQMMMGPHPCKWSWSSKCRTAYVCQGSRGPIAWTYRSVDARDYMDMIFQFNAAANRKFWRYLVERIPVEAGLEGAIRAASREKKAA